MPAAHPILSGSSHLKLIYLDIHLIVTRLTAPWLILMTMDIEDGLPYTIRLSCNDNDTDLRKVWPVHELIRADRTCPSRGICLDG